MSRLRSAALVVLASLAVGPAAPAWEADSTHAGLTEAAALASRLHARLVALHGRRAGLLEPVTFAPERAFALFDKLRVLEPTSGVVPDRRGRQSALAWLLAGAVVEGMPAERGRNHFYDPTRKAGRDGGVAAPDWIFAKDNDLGMDRFWLELERSASAPGPTERDEHLAMALIGAGAMLHVLEDMGVPARVRSDERAFHAQIGEDRMDRGARYERLAALLFGRLGVPAPSAAVVRPHARDWFTAADGKGLADVTHARWYSPGTLPGTVEVPRSAKHGEVLERVVASQKVPTPKPERELNLAGAADGLVLRDDAGVCLATYRVEDHRLSFAISDDCAGEQLGVILPQVGGYAAGLLDWLFRGSLAVVVDGGKAQVIVPRNETQLGNGTLTLLGEDALGKRSVIATQPWSGPASISVPAGFARVVAVFRGQDAAGDELVAVGWAGAK